MSASADAAASHATETSTVRLYLMRTLYLLIAVAVGADIWPRVLGAGGPMDAMDGVAYAFWATLSLLAILGIRYPLKMVPLLLVQLAYKSIWLLAVARPAWRAGSPDSAVAAMAREFLFGVGLT